MSEILDKSNRKKGECGRFISEINKDTVSRQNSDREKEMIEKFIKERENGKL